MLAPEQGVQDVASCPTKLTPLPLLPCLSPSHMSIASMLRCHCHSPFLCLTQFLFGRGAGVLTGGRSPCPSVAGLRGSLEPSSALPCSVPSG